jgi:preprotein translocase subunit SecA
MRAEVQVQQPDPVGLELPDFITQHIDPLTGEDNSDDYDLASLAGVETLAPPAAPRPEAMPDGSPVPVPESRNAPCPCGSGLKYKNCHGQLA